MNCIVGSILVFLIFYLTVKVQVKEALFPVGRMGRSVSGFDGQRRPVLRHRNVTGRIPARHYSRVVLRFRFDIVLPITRIWMKRRSAAPFQRVRRLPVSVKGMSVHYQTLTRSSGARYIGSPSVMPNAVKKSSMLRSVTFTLFLPSECGSSLVRRRISSGRMFCAHTVA